MAIALPVVSEDFTPSTSARPSAIACTARDASNAPAAPSPEAADSEPCARPGGGLAGEGGVDAQSRPPRPLMLFIETVNACNHLCRICAYKDQTRARRAMSMATFEQAVRQYVAWGGGPLSFTPIVGEAMLDPWIFRRLDLLAPFREAGAVTTLSVTTNATALERFDDAALDRLAAGFDRFKVSVYGIDAEEFEAMTQKPLYGRMVSGLKRLLARSPGRVWVGFRFLKRRSEEEAREWLAGVAREAGHDGPVPVGSITGTYANWGQMATPALPFEGAWAPAPSEPHRGQCFVPRLGVQVLSSGHVSFCNCANFDAHEQLIIGHVAERPLAEMYESERVRRLWRWSEFGTPEFCRRCSFHMPMSTATDRPDVFRDPVAFVGA